MSGRAGRGVYVATGRGEARRGGRAHIHVLSVGHAIAETGHDVVCEAGEGVSLSSRRARVRWREGTTDQLHSRGRSTSQQGLQSRNTSAAAQRGGCCWGRDLGSITSRVWEGRAGRFGRHCTLEISSCPRPRKGSDALTSPREERETRRNKGATQAAIRQTTETRVTKYL